MTQTILTLAAQIVKAGKTATPGPWIEWRPRPGSEPRGWVISREDLGYEYDDMKPIITAINSDGGNAKFIALARQSDQVAAALLRAVDMMHKLRPHIIHSIAASSLLESDFNKRINTGRSESGCVALLDLDKFLADLGKEMT